MDLDRGGGENVVDAGENEEDEDGDGDDRDGVVVADRGENAADDDEDPDNPDAEEIDDDDVAGVTYPDIVWRLLEGDEGVAPLI